MRVIKAASRMVLDHLPERPRSEAGTEGAVHARARIPAHQMSHTFR